MADLMNPGADSKCSESSILELFAADQALTDSQFLDAVNDPNATSLISGIVNLSKLTSMQGWTKLPFPCCENDSSKFRQKW